MRVLVTGAGGFVGPYLVDALRARFGDELQLVLTSKDGIHNADVGMIEPLDVVDAQAVEEVVRHAQPDFIVHLAGLAAVPAASANTDLAWQIHLNGSLNIAYSILRHAPQCTLLYVGSGQIYGASARDGTPLTEASLPAPTNAYGATKAAADLAIGALSEEGLRCFRLRPFNHIGPGQSEDFAIPSFAMQIARIEASMHAPTVRVGNLDAERDFLDVRDVADAYALVIAKSSVIPNGTIFNIASGVPYRMRTLLEKLLSLSTVSIGVEEDAARMRPSDTPRFIGDAALARRLLDWSPKYSLDTTLTDVLNHSRASVARSRRLN